MKQSKNGIEMRSIKCSNRFKSIWRDMLRRIDDKKWHSYHLYGGRGISVSKRWRRFKNFYDDMYESYIIHSDEYSEANTTLDRIDMDGNYNKGNCRWATRLAQGNNTSRCAYIYYNKVKMTITELARIFPDIDRKTLWYRIVKLGMTPEEAVSAKGKLTNNIAANKAKHGKTKQRTFEYNGKMLTCRELSEFSEVSYATLKSRLYMYGWSVKDAIRK